MHCTLRAVWGLMSGSLTDLDIIILSKYHQQKQGNLQKKLTYSTQSKHI